MAGHRLRVDEPPARVARRRPHGLLLAVADVGAAVGMGFFAPGVSPSLAFVAIIAPLPVWAALFAAAAACQVLGRSLVGHSIATPLWAMLALGAVLGLLGGVSTAPAASIILTGLELSVAGHHVAAMVQHRQEAQARRDGR